MTMEKDSRGGYIKREIFSSVAEKAGEIVNSTKRQAEHSNTAWQWVT
jgi:hypothetical protein